MPKQINLTFTKTSMMLIVMSISVNTSTHHWVVHYFIAEQLGGYKIGCIRYKAYVSVFGLGFFIILLYIFYTYSLFVKST